LVLGPLACGIDTSGLGGPNSGLGGSSSGGQTTGTETGGATAATSDSGSDATVGSASEATSDSSDSTGQVVSTSDGSTSSDTTGDASSSSSTGDEDDCFPLIVETLNRLSGSDSGREWIKLHNPCMRELDLEGFVLGWAGSSTIYTLELDESIPAQGCILVGGPTSDDSNFNPDLTIEHEFDPQLISSAGAIFIYDIDPDDISITTVPLDVLIWGSSNGQGYLDPDGDVPDPYVGQTPNNDSIHRTSLDRTFAHQDPPQPNVCPGF
jgi:hypothetical protein